jgi:succinoglycan biosynthesis transport protein ExoP
MHQGKIPFTGRPTDEVEGGGDKFIDLERLLAVARRQAATVATIAGVGLLLGIVYIVFATPFYTSATSILLDDNLGKFADDVSPMPANMQADTTILSQIAILKSGELAAKVVEKEKLYDNPVFMNPPTSLSSVIKSSLKGALALLDGSGDEEGGEGDRAKIGRAVGILQQGLLVERQGRSLVIDLSYVSHDPRLAGRITRAYADAYLSDQLDANFDATRRAAVWLQGRLTDLRESSQNAAMEVERFRTANGLTAARGTLVSEQQLSDINSQLILAQADTARAGASYNQYRNIVAAGIDSAVESAAALGDTGDSSVLGGLRTRYLLISRRLQEIVSRFGAQHAQAVALRTEQEEVKRQMFAEIKQLTESYRNQLEVAQSRETSLRESLQKITGVTSTANEALVRLRELEQNALTLGNLYQTYLTRYQEAQQQQSFPIAKARVISIAATPSEPSSPKKTMALVASLLLGTVAGAAVGALREFRERFFRVGTDVQNALGLKFLGYLPAVAGSDKQDSAAGGTVDNTRIAVDAPGSLFAETLRNAKIAADVVLQGREGKVIGVVSVLPREGKSTVSANFARLLAAKGIPTLLIDADLRNPGLTRALKLSPQTGLVNALLGEQDWHSCVTFDNATNLAIIPAVLHRHLRHTAELVSGERMRRIIEEARASFSFIIVDLPPLGPVVDAKAFAPFADGFLMVAEWGVTPRTLVKHTLQSEPQIASKMLGAILNKADMRNLAKYSAFGSSEKFFGRYSSYYIDQLGSPEPSRSRFNPREWIKEMRSKAGGLGRSKAGAP